MRFTPVCLLLLLVSLTVAPFFPTRTAHAQPPDEQLGEAAAFLQLFPELRVLPKPTWFEAGARASYQSIGAVSGGGVAGGGIVQYDAVASDGLQSLVAVQSFTDNGAGQLIPLGWNMKLAVPAVGEYWLHPFALARAEEVANQNLSVVRLNKIYAGQDVTVVRFQADLTNSRTVWEFEVTSGLLMFYSQRIISGGTEQMSQLLFLNFRTVQLPWVAGRAPNWMRPGVVMGFTGQQVTTLPGASSFSSPYATRVILNPTALTWSINTLTVFLNGIDMGSTVQTTGVGQVFGGMWLPREALAVNVQGETTLDTDPVTGVVTTLQRDGSTGAIVLRQVNNAHDIFMIYNPTLGSLDRHIQTMISPTSIIQTDVSRTDGDNLAALNQLPELPVPISGLTASHDGPTVLGEATTFAAQFTGGEPTSYTWDFGDGNTGAGRTPSHTYATPGEYTVTVVATNEANTMTATTTVTIVAAAPPLISGLTASNNGPTQVGEATLFETQFTGGAPTSYVWDFGDGATGRGASPSHAYAVSGLYTATVVASNATNSLSATVKVYVGDAVVEVRNNSFSPAEVTVPSGGKVVWVLVEGNHSVTADDGSFEQPAGSNWPPFLHTFNVPASARVGRADATFTYHCSVHGQSMSGRVIVDADALPGGNKLRLPALAR